MSIIQMFHKKMECHMIILLFHHIRQMAVKDIWQEQEVPAVGIEKAEGALCSIKGVMY